MLEEAYALDPSDFKAETSGTTYNHTISLKDLMMATTIDEQLKKDFDSKFNTLDHDKPSKDLKDAIREARFLEEKMIMQKTMSFVLNMPLMRALKGIYRIIKSGIEGMLGQGFDPDKDYATLIANAIKEGDYSNLQKYINERDAKLDSDKEKYKDAQTTGAYLISLGYVSVREYLNRKGYADEQITCENGKVCVTVNEKKYPLDIAGIALTGYTNYASEENIDKAIKKAEVPECESKTGKTEGITSEGTSKTVDDFIKANVNPNFQQNVKNAFTSDAKATTLTKDLTVYRYHGGTSSGKSYWYTPNLTSNPAADLALPAGNTYQYVDTYIIPKGTTILEGTVAPNFGQPGGGYQIYVPNPTVVIPK
ncbi:MAG: glycohydrolase toxin TNT-related protein [Acetivibrionales bacterium]